MAQQENKMEQREVSIKTIPFLGLDQDWREWHTKVCSIQGHKAAYCQRGQVLKTADANTTNIPKGKCYTWGKVGHYDLECRNKPRENVGLFVNMTETIDNEGWMPRKRSPEPKQEAYFDTSNIKGSLVSTLGPCWLQWQGSFAICLQRHSWTKPLKLSRIMTWYTRRATTGRRRQ
jgi:hypothetical protein